MPWVKFFILAFLFVNTSLLKSFSQENTLYFMNAHPQSNLLNPAVQYNYSAIILSPSYSASLENSSLTFNNIFNIKTVGGNSVLYLDFESMEKKLRTNNLVRARMEITPVFAGLKLPNNMYGSFSFSLKNKTFFKYPGTVIDLRYGNADLSKNKPRTIDLNNYALDEITYAEYSFGLSKKYTNNFAFGAHLKLLMGLFTAQTEQFKASVETSDDFSESLLKTNIRMNVSAPLVNIDENKLSINNALLRNNIQVNSNTFKNFGLAVDLGFTYKVNEQLDVYGSVNDLGFIHWGGDPQQLVSKGEYLFDGLYFSTDNLDNFNAEEYFKHYADTISSTFIPTSESKSFNSRLFAKSYLAAAYQMNEKVKLNALLKSTLYKNLYYLEGTLGATYTPNRTWAFTGTWSYRNHSLYNFGAGVLVTGKRLQFFAVTDNINSIDLINSKGINAAFGLNILILPPEKQAPIKKTIQLF